MESVNIIEKKTREKASLSKTLAIVALIASIVYVIEGGFSVLFALVPIPVIGFFISIILTVVELCLFVLAVVLIVCAFVNRAKVRKALENLADVPEKQDAEKCLKIAAVLSYVATGITSVSFCVLSVLNLVEFVFSFI